MSFLKKYQDLQQEMIDSFKVYFQPEIEICQQIFDLSLDLQDEGYSVGFLLTAGDKRQDPMKIVTCLTLNKKCEVNYIDHGYDIITKAEILDNDHRVGFFIRISIEKSLATHDEIIRRSNLMFDLVQRVKSFFPDLYIKYSTTEARINVQEYGEMSYSSIVCVTRF